MNITDFFNNDYGDYASYDNIRKIASNIDGLKISMRKCLYTVLNNKINSPIKVSQLMAKVSEKTQYLHGEQSLYGVIVGMAQDISGVNNIPFFQREGAFGSRIIPEAAASRYIFTCKENYLDFIYRSEDEDILSNQFFEGNQIEYNFYIPIIPMLLVNGSIGLTTGFSQKILSRNPKELIDWIVCRLDNKKFNGNMLPWFKNFKGSVKQSKDDPKCFFIYGHYNKINNHQIEIDEVPIGYDLKSYISVLDKLIEDKKIKDYDDYSEDGKFNIKVTFFRNQGLDLNSCDVYSELKLYKSVTESYTSLYIDNKIVEYNNVDEMLEDFFKIRYSYYEKRKESLLIKLEKIIRQNASKYTFIKCVIDGTVDLKNKQVELIYDKLSTIKNIIKIDDSYEYLLNIPISSITKEKYNNLMKNLLELKNKYTELYNMSIEDMWKNDLKELNKVMK